VTTLCPKCQSENSDTAKFCSECATLLQPSKDIGITKTIESPVEELIRGTTLADRYQIIEELGKGGMGTVFRVEDTKIGQDIALKLIKPDISSDKKTIERFRNELKTTRMISHRNVCRMFDLGDSEGTYFITMEYIPGEDLKSFIRRVGQLPSGKAISITRQACEGLAEAHRLGVVHRDLKPGNIMVDKEGNVRIMDFGIARSMSGEGLTMEGVIIGTPEYMSPEQAGGEEVDTRADIYSLGVIMYEMVTGQLPFEGDSPLNIAMMHKSEAPPNPKWQNPQIPDALGRIILTCLEKEKGRRFQTVEDLISELNKIEETRHEDMKISGWKNSIAVLPFKNMSADPEQEYFCEGLSEELINAFTQIKDLRVVARTSAFSFKDKELDIREIGKKLNVDTVLEGSVRKARNRLRITAQLINVDDGYHLWSERFDREMADVFAIQDEITLAITDRMRLKLLGEDKARMIKRSTKNFEAYNLYLRGLHFRRKLTVDSINKAIEYFNKAIELDPENALAFAGLAYSHMALPWYAPVTHKEAYPKAKKAAMKAMELDDQLVEVYEALAAIRTYLEWDWEGGKRECHRMLELNPGYSWGYFHLAMVLLYRAKYQDCIKEFRRALELDPLNVAGHRNLGIAYLRAGQLDKAEETLRKTTEMDPSFIYTRLNLSYIYMLKDKHEEALTAIQNETITSKALLEPHIGIVYARMGKQEEARKILNQQTELSKREFTSPYLLAALCFALKENDLGFQWMEKAYEEHDPWMGYLKIDFLLDSVRQDSRFKALLKKMNLD
jgi:serine/threonine protein kinase/Tfp pilus assembly protein PilF